MITIMMITIIIIDHQIKENSTTIYMLKINPI